MNRLADAEVSADGERDNSQDVIDARGRAKRELRLPTHLLLLPAIIATIVAGSLVSSAFLTSGNLVQNVGGNSAALALVAFGEMLILISGNIDLSLQSIIGFSPMIAALLMTSEAAGGTGLGLPPALGLVLAVASGAIIGLLNGLMIIKLRLNSFMVTLAMLIVLSGLTLGFSNGQTVAPIPDAFSYLGSKQWLTVPVSVWMVLVVALVLEGILRYHRWGRATYAVGGNLDAARASGLRVDLVRIGAFVLGGALAALAGVVLAGITGAVPANQGSNMIFTVFAAVVIGGVSLEGGKGNVVGAVCGVALLALITNVLTLAQISDFWINACYGVVILLALFIARIGGRDET